MNEDVINNYNRASLGEPGHVVILLNNLNGSFFSLVLPQLFMNTIYQSFSLFKLFEGRGMVIASLNTMKQLED